MYVVHDDVLTDLPKPETRVVRGPFREEEGGRSVRPPYCPSPTDEGAEEQDD